MLICLHASSQHTACTLTASSQDTGYLNSFILVFYSVNISVSWQHSILLHCDVSDDNKNGGFNQEGHFYKLLSRQPRHLSNLSRSSWSITCCNVCCKDKTLCVWSWTRAQNLYHSLYILSMPALPLTNTAPEWLLKETIQVSRAHRRVHRWWTPIITNICV